MRRLIIALGFSVICFTVEAQIEGTSIPSLPQLTGAEMASVTSPNIGSTIFNTDDEKVYRFTTNGWVSDTDTSIYTADGTLSANRAVTQNNFDLNFDANTLVIDGSANRVGIGTTVPSKKLEVRDDNASIAVMANSESQDATLFLGTPFNSNSPAKAAIIAEGISSWSRSKLHFALDDQSNNTSSFEADITDSKMTIEFNGDVGIGTTDPSTKLDVNGNARVRTLPAAADTDQLVSADTNGNLRKVNSLKASKVFYPPSIAIDASTTGTFNVDLYAEYIAQFGSPVVSSGGTIPTYTVSELDYHVTYADPDVFGNGTTVQNMSVNASGVLSYEVFNTPADYNSLINVVFVVK